MYKYFDNLNKINLERFCIFSKIIIFQDNFFLQYWASKLLWTKGQMSSFPLKNKMLFGSFTNQAWKHDHQVLLRDITVCVVLILQQKDDNKSLKQSCSFFMNFSLQLLLWDYNS